MKKGPVRREPDPSRVSLLAGFHADASARRPPRAFGPTRVPRRPVGSVFVVVVPVQGVAMRAVDVVDVIAVLNGLMPAPLTMGVLGKGVLGVQIVAHGNSFRSCS